LEAEKALGRVASEKDMAIITLRPPLVYGPNVKANFLKLLKFVDRGIPLPLASINNQRSLIYVENLVDAIVRCIRYEHSTVKTYLIRDSVDISTPELIRMIASSLGRPARLFRVPPKILKAISRLLGKEMEVERLTGSLTVDDTKIRQDLGWKPPFTTECGLKKTIEWYKKVHSS
jgi:nucleoside-diphosphate-sugar epimerase